MNRDWEFNKMQGKVDKRMDKKEKGQLDRIEAKMDILFDKLATPTILYSSNDSTNTKQQELDRTKIEVLEGIFQACYQEDSKTLELVEDKLKELRNEKI